MKNKIKGSILIFGANEAKRAEKVSQILADLELKESESNPDLHFVTLLEEKKSLGIDQVRKLISFLSQKPYSALSKAVVIPQAQKLTNDAQNSLLKTLEEPPSYATIILCTRTEEELLPTVLSRCQRIRLANDRVGESSGDSIQDLLKMTLGERFSWAETQSKEEKDDVVKLLENWIEQERQEMVKNVDDIKRQNIELLLQIKTDLEKTNVGLRLALEYLVLNLK